MVEKTLILLKPEALENQTAHHEILRRIDEMGQVLSRRYLDADRTMVEEHYAQHQGRDYFDRIVSAIAGRRIAVFLVKGENVIERWRETMGLFREGERLPGTIRGDLMKPGDPPHRNFVHGSDSVENASREEAIWFARSAHSMPTPTH